MRDVAATASPGRRGAGLVLVAALLVSTLAVPDTAWAAWSSDTVAAPDATAACPPVDVSEDGFPDVALDATHETLIDCTVWWGVARGRAVEQYAPRRTVTRAQMASFLVALLEAVGRPAPTDAPNAFRDDDGHEHERSIDRLAAAEITDGRTASTYGPDDRVTRAQMASLLVATYGYASGLDRSSSTDHFTDDEGSVHEPSIDVAASAGLAQGVSSRRFAPSGPVSRAQMATFLARLLDIAVRDGEARPPPPDPMLVGAGDIVVCGSDRHEATARLLDGLRGTVITLGDNVYTSGTPEEFACYDRSWGRHLDRTRPAPGNHDVGYQDGAGYYDYFGERAGPRGKGWYAYPVGDHWLAVALNSNCRQVGCAADSEQVRWLRQTLADNVDRHVVAYWHHARWSTGVHGASSAVSALWDVLVEHGVELALVGHDHDYERFVPLDEAGERDDARGVRQIVVGTGGVGLRDFQAQAASTSVVRSADSHGVIALTLGRDAYSWRFVPVPGDTFVDLGRDRLH